MKTHKNIWLSLGSYVLAALWFVGAIQLGSILLVARHRSYGDISNTFVLVIFFVLLVLGVFFGSKSNRAKESSWAGNLLIATGLVVIIGYLLLMSGFFMRY